jgi:hypothetical protein
LSSSHTASADASSSAEPTPAAMGSPSVKAVLAPVSRPCALSAGRLLAATVAALAVPTSRVICRSPELRRCKLSQTMSSRLCLKLVSFFETASNVGLAREGVIHTPVNAQVAHFVTVTALGVRSFTCPHNYVVRQPGQA